MSGMMAVSLKIFAYNVHAYIGRFMVREWTYAMMPLLGIGLTVIIVSVFFKGVLERGVPSVLYAIAQKSGIMKRVNTYVHVITSGITVGFGGSAGLEAPIVATGSAIGSNVGRILRLNYNERILILASGAAAGIAAAFNAPIAGVMFAIEVLLPEAIVSHFVTLLISSAIGALCSKIILNEDILFNFVLRQSFDYANVPLYIVLGVICGFFSLYYAKVTHWVEHLFSGIKEKWLKVMIGGFILMGLTSLFPSLFGEGYISVKAIANGNAFSLIDHPLWERWGRTDEMLLIFVGCVIFLKVFATSITLSSGGNGGNFAPSLFMGAYLGFFFAHGLNTLKWFKLPESNFTIVGMAGILSGVMYTPITAIFLIAEVTNGYELLIPLMIVSSASFFVAKHFEPYSMDTKKMAEKGTIFTTDRDHNTLTQLKLLRMVEGDVQKVQPQQTLRDLVEAIKSSRRNLFAVVDEDNLFQGVIVIDDIKEIMFNQEMYDWVLVQDLMSSPPETIQVQETMEEVMRKFEKTKSWNLPVLDGDKYVGIVSKSSIFNEYRKVITHHQDLYPNDH
jgi:CIC family chloride channel protein